MQFPDVPGDALDFGPALTMTARDVQVNWDHMILGTFDKVRVLTWM